MSDGHKVTKARLKVGQLPVREGKLTIPRVSQVLLSQRRGDGRQFGRIAMDLGFVSERDAALALLTT